MRDRLAVVAVLAASAAAGVWFLSHQVRMPAGRLRRPPLLAAPQFSSGVLARPYPARSLLYSPAAPSTPTDGFVATLASQAGPYTVSVRGLRPAAPSSASRRPGQSLAWPQGPFYLALQVSGGEGMLRRCRLDRSSLRARDDTGRLLRWEAQPDDMTLPFRLRYGRAYFVRMESPAPGARALRWIEGAIAVDVSAGATTRYAFRIEGVPLPNVPSLYGRAASRILSPGTSRALPAGLAVLTGDAAALAMASSRPAEVAPRFSPQLLHIGPVLPVKLVVPTPESGTRLSLGASPGALGGISLSLFAGSEGWRGEVWDGDTVLVALPGRRAARMALALRLSRTLEPPAPIADPTSPFPPGEGQAGGSVTSAVSVSGRPFGRGILRVGISQRAEGRWSSPAFLDVPIRADGSMTLANLAAGTYRIQRPVSGLAAIVNGEPSVVPATPYLRARFHAAGGEWTGQTLPSVAVRPGECTLAAPLAWRAKAPLIAAPAAGRTDRE